MSRQSVWPSAPPPADHLHYLEDCISATEHCVMSLTSTLDKFRPGIQDFPRLNRILINEHVRYIPPLHLLIVRSTGTWGRRWSVSLCGSGYTVKCWHPEIPRPTPNNNLNPLILNLLPPKPRNNKTFKTRRTTSRGRTNKVERHRKNNRYPTISFTPSFSSYTIQCWGWGGGYMEW